LELKHRALTTNEHLKRYFGLYEESKQVPDYVMQEHMNWASTLTEDELIFALNIENHPMHGAYRPRPKLPVLMGLVKQYRDDKGYRRVEDIGKPKEVEKSYCRYCCVDGIVVDIVDLETLETVNLGKCKHCSGGDAEPSMCGLMDKYPNLSAIDIFLSLCKIKMLRKMDVNFTKQDTATDLEKRLLQIEIMGKMIIAKLNDPEGFEKAFSNKVNSLQPEFPNQDSDIPF
jgi:hypothetical protein